MDKTDKAKKYSPEVKERAVRMVLEARSDHPSSWSAVESITQKMGCVPQTQLGKRDLQAVWRGVEQRVRMVSA